MKPLRQIYDEIEDGELSFGDFIDEIDYRVDEAKDEGYEDGCVDSDYQYDRGYDEGYDDGERYLRGFAIETIEDEIKFELLMEKMNRKYSLKEIERMLK